MIKSADKGDVTVIMSSEYYYNMCMNELNKEQVYKRMGKNDPSKLVYRKVLEFANRYKDTLTKKEYQFLTQKEYRMANFYSVPKLHKSAISISYCKMVRSISISRTLLILSRVDP